jgi:hypothetical protein
MYGISFDLGLSTNSSLVESDRNYEGKKVIQTEIGD